MILIYVLVWICFGAVTAMVTSNKGNDTFVGFILGVLLGPIGLLISYVSSKNQEDYANATGKTENVLTVRVC